MSRLIGWLSLGRLYALKETQAKRFSKAPRGNPSSEKLRRRNDLRLASNLANASPLVKLGFPVWSLESAPLACVLRLGIHHRCGKAQSPGLEHGAGTQDSTSQFLCLKFED